MESVDSTCIYAASPLPKASVVTLPCFDPGIYKVSSVSASLVQLEGRYRDFLVEIKNPLYAGRIGHVRASLDDMPTLPEGCGDRVAQPA